MSKGFIIPIGGAEEKVRDAAILGRFVELCGGDSARLAVIPTASQLEETGERYRKLFNEAGAREVVVIDGDRREDWAEPRALEPVVIGVDAEPGDTVRVTPTDYGRVPVEGELVRADAHEFALRRTTAETGVIVTHFPRMGFALES